MIESEQQHDAEILNNANFDSSTFDSSAADYSEYSEISDTNSTADITSPSQEQLEELVTYLEENDLLEQLTHEEMQELEHLLNLPGGLGGGLLQVDLNGYLCGPSSKAASKIAAMLKQQKKCLVSNIS